MSGFGADTSEGGVGFTEAGTSTSIGGPSIDLLSAEAIIPGSPAETAPARPSWHTTRLAPKTGGKPHRLGAEPGACITVSNGPESRLVPAFKKEWKETGGAANVTGGPVGADAIILNLYRTVLCAYGIASLIVGDRKNQTHRKRRFDLAKVHETDPYYNVLDPLNTAGSLVLDQDPNSPNFQKPPRCVLVTAPIIRAARLS